MHPPIETSTSSPNEESTLGMYTKSYRFFVLRPSEASDRPGAISASYLEVMTISTVFRNAVLGDKPSRQCWHNRCVLLIAPHPGHLHRLFTSLSAFPAICLCLLREWEVLFFGTAFRMPSQMSPRSPGMFRLMPGRAMESEGRRRREYRVV